jgi:hypothetical protein
VTRAQPWVLAIVSLAIACRSSEHEPRDERVPPTPTTPTTRCSVQIGPASAAASDTVRAELAKRHPDWTAKSFDEITGALREVTAPRRTPSTTGETSTLDDATFEARARAAIAELHDLFGLDRTDLAAARVEVRRAHGVLVTVRGTRPLRGFEALDVVDLRWKLHVLLDGDGNVDNIRGGGLILPRFELCTDARLAATDPAVTAGVVGQVLTYGSFDGDKAQAGPVTRDHVRDVALSVFVDRRARDRVIVSLAYKVSVELGALPWTFYVDPDDGHVLRIVQGFET